MLDIMRRYVHGFVNSHDFTVPLEIMTSDYVLHVGTETIVGRDDRYLPAVQQQIDQFPHLGYSIHDLVTDGQAAAILMSEHGRSARRPDRQAAWIGVAIYRAEGDRLVECWAEQDHYGKRRQLETGIDDGLAPVATDPWAGHEAATPDASAAAQPIVAAWLDRLEVWPPEGADLDPGQAQAEQPRIRITGTSLGVVVAEGDRVGFNAGITGEYLGGLPGYDERIGMTVQTWVGALGVLRDGEVTGLRGASNRIAVNRQLRDAEQHGGA